MSQTNTGIFVFDLADLIIGFYIESIRCDFSYFLTMISTNQG
jgi:hypothetical protein